MTNKNERVRFTLRLPDKLLRKITNESNELGVSSNSLILQILWNYIESKE